ARSRAGLAAVRLGNLSHEREPEPFARRLGRAVLRHAAEEGLEGLLELAGPVDMELDRLAAVALRVVEEPGDRAREERRVGAHRSRGAVDDKRLLRQVGDLDRSP